jgi:hypothetical protein
MYSILSYLLQVGEAQLVHNASEENNSAGQLHHLVHFLTFRTLFLLDLDQFVNVCPSVPRQFTVEVLFEVRLLMTVLIHDHCLQLLQKPCP